MPVAFSTGARSASQLSSAACTFSGRRGSALAPTPAASAMATTVDATMALMRCLPLLEACSNKPNFKAVSNLELPILRGVCAPCCAPEDATGKLNDDDVV